MSFHSENLCGMSEVVECPFDIGIGFVGVELIVCPGHVAVP